MDKGPLKDLDSDTLLIARKFLTGKKTFWQVVGSIQTYFAVAAFMAGGMWFIYGGVAIMSAYLIKDTPAQLRAIDGELERRGLNDNRD